jgi:hypothetical protein
MDLTLEALAIILVVLGVLITRFAHNLPGSTHHKEVEK